MQLDPMSEGDATAGRTSLSRRRLMAVSAAALLAAGCRGGGGSGRSGSGSDSSSGGDGGSGEDAHGPSGVLGANFNEDPSEVTFSALEGLSASWLRGFLLMSDVKEGDSVTAQPAVSTLLKAREKGYGTLLSMKFQNSNREIPAPGSPQMKEELARVDRTLQAVMDKVNILTIGNEPFLETRKKDRNSKLNAFYETVAEHVVAYRKKHFASGCTTRLYMGALNHLDQPGGQTAATDRWMSFVRKTPEIEGVDIHPHVDSAEGAQKYLDYVLPKLRRDQKFLATEFSLVLLWKEHMTSTVSAKFAQRYDLPRDTKVWQVLRTAVAEPFPEEKWHDFLSMSPWYESHKHFMRNQVEKFRRTGRLAVATYGVVQASAMSRNIGPTKPPWLLNSLYANRTVAHSDSGELPHNYPVFDDFRALQRKQDRLPVRTGKTSTQKTYTRKTSTQKTSG